jgi:hypothetical protein
METWELKLSVMQDIWKIYPQAVVAEIPVSINSPIYNLEINLEECMLFDSNGDIVEGDYSEDFTFDETIYTNSDRLKALLNAADVTEATIVIDARCLDNPINALRREYAVFDKAIKKLEKRAMLSAGVTAAIDAYKSSEFATSNIVGLYHHVNYALKTNKQDDSQTVLDVMADILRAAGIPLYTNEDNK